MKNIAFALLLVLFFTSACVPAGSQNATSVSIPTHLALDTSTSTPLTPDTPTPTPEATAPARIVIVTDLKDVATAPDASTVEKRAIIAQGILAGVNAGTIPGISSGVEPYLPEKISKIHVYSKLDFFNTDQLYSGASTDSSKRPVRGVTLAQGQNGEIWGIQLIKGQNGYGLIWYDLGNNSYTPGHVDDLFNRDLSNPKVTLGPVKINEIDSKTCAGWYGKSVCDIYQDPQTLAEQERVCDLFISSGGIVPAEMTNGKVSFVPGLYIFSN